MKGLLSVMKTLNCNKIWCCGNLLAGGRKYSLPY